MQLAKRLAAAGYRHCSPPEQPWEPQERFFFEVYPHPAHVMLFESSRIIKYKKGAVAARRIALGELKGEIRTRIFGPNSPFQLAPSIAPFLATDVGSLRGRGLKEHEDLLDAILCAYLAFHLWRWGWRKNEMIGDLESGYIVVPTSSLPGPRARDGNDPDSI